jgi:serine/threonine protein kinase
MGIENLHNKNIIHRDLKPENFLIGDDGYIKLADFGCSKDLNENHFTGDSIGTPLYMAPEIFRFEQYTKAADIWSLGCVIYEFIHGYTPYFFEELDIDIILECIETNEITYKFNIDLNSKQLL